jgi:ACR3 family arsenite transporter
MEDYPEKINAGNIIFYRIRNRYSDHSWDFLRDAGSIVGLVGSTLLLQAAAPPVGIALGLSAPAVLIVMACFALGMILAIFEICDSLADSSARVKNWLEKIGKTSEKYPQIQKYGPVTCIGIAWIPGIGLYGTPVIAWILGWKRLHAIIFTTLGFTIASFFVLFFSSRIPELLFFAANAGVVIFIITSMIALGFSFTLAQVRATFANQKFLVLALVANFIFVPLLAYLLVFGLKLPTGLAFGMILVGTAAGSPFLPRIIHVTKEKHALAGAIAVLLTVISVFYVPVVAPLMMPGEAVVNPVLYLLAFIVLILVPLGGALFLRSKHEARAVRYTPWLSKISYIAFIAAFIAVFGVYYTQLPGIIGTGGFLAVIAFILVAFGIGYLLGGNRPGERAVSAFGTAQRNLAVALVLPILDQLLTFFIPGFSIFDPTALIMVLTVGIAGLILLTLLGRLLARRAEPGRLPAS